MRFVLQLCVFTLLFPSAASPAHHSSSAFDTTKEVTLKGTVVKWGWINPHVILQFDVKNEKGEVVTWAGEAGNPANMTRQGWARASFKTGDAIAVTLLPSRNGAPAGILVRVVLESTGQKFVTTVPPRVDATGKAIPDDSSRSQPSVEQPPGR